MATRSAGSKKNRTKSHKKMHKGTKLPSIKALRGTHITIGGKL